VQILRMVLAGVFDRFPDLQLITGHWGEVVLFYLERIDGLSRVTKLERPISEYFRHNVSVTPSGMWSERYLRWALDSGLNALCFQATIPTGSRPAAERVISLNPPTCRMRTELQSRMATGSGWLLKFAVADFRDP
jgi:hypothetical protein